ncbi:uncharacterized protein LOC127751683 [Frankliniella occidentalis]|uniref:Uncharacterized protein LOC127751683 n=1 Tax=Frankliniella occidentalis TaxID=133901 RepID=A0A9C6XUY9_FRAOC|nr:uncharacterized protein LOC127751683 [Frankliniella occidentalis]
MILSKKQRPEENLNKTMDKLSVDVVDVAVEKALLKQLKKFTITEVYGRTVSKRRTKFSLSYDIPPPNYLSGSKGAAAQREHFAAILNQIPSKLWKGKLIGRNELIFVKDAEQIKN